MNIYDTSVIDELGDFHGTENWYKHRLSSMIYTDGIKWLANRLECYWLIDDIAIFSKKLREKHYFLTIKFKANAKMKGKLVFEDENGLILLTKNYYFCDLITPKKSLNLLLYFDGGFETHVLFLPSEY